MLRLKNSALSLVIFSALILFLSCTDDFEPKGPETWLGTMTMVTGIGTYRDSTVDTLRLIIDSPDYDLLLTTRECNLCDSRGTVTSFGLPESFFTPTYINWAGNCDSVRVPKGAFQAVFTGDNVTLFKDTSAAINPTWTFRFKLSLKK